jgi:hypothetical protein
MSNTQKQPKRRWPLGDYGLSVVLAALFLSAWIGQFIAQLSVVKDEAAEHGQSFEWSQFWPQFWHSTLENWQSEFLQLLTFVILTAFLIHRGSAESKDSDDEMQTALERIEARLERMEGDRGHVGARASTPAGAPHHEPAEAQTGPPSPNGGG